jgi:hypothetical protein
MPVEKERGANAQSQTHAPSAELYKATCLSLDRWLSVLAVPDFELYTTNSNCATLPLEEKG